MRRRRSRVWAAYSARGGAERRTAAQIAQDQTDEALGITRTGPGNRSTLRDLFRKGDDPNTTVKVNKYIWEASLDVLNFLPIAIG